MYDLDLYLDSNVLKPSKHPPPRTPVLPHPGHSYGIQSRQRGSEFGQHSKQGYIL